MWGPAFLNLTTFPQKGGFILLSYVVFFAIFSIFISAIL